MSRQRRGILEKLRSEAPNLGLAGSRSASLHLDSSTPDSPPLPRRLHELFLLRWVGTIGSLLIVVGSLGAGALPVVNNPYLQLPGGAFFSRMLHASTATVFLGVGFLIFAWVKTAPHVGAPIKGPATNYPARGSHMWRMWLCWSLPLLFAAPLFTQDIYSYLAQGSIVARGLDPYSAGPVQILGADNVLARSVPFIWANSPSPYGPVALGIAGAISWLTDDSIVWGVISHRLCSFAGLIAAGWAIEKMATRCNVSPAAALWLGLLNPLTLLHLIGGIHNEAILLGLLLVGVELGLRGLDSRRPTLFLFSGVLIACAGAVKVTGFLALGFTGMALAHLLHYRRGWSAWKAITCAALVQLMILVATIAMVTLITGIPLGWITGQGGAVSIRSWLSGTTAVGVAAGAMGMLLGLGDHTDSILTITRLVGIAIAGAFMIRFLFATFKNAIHPVGALGVSTLVMVILFPVVHPWYILWAVLPLAAWANRLIFRLSVVGYSAFMSFVVLPRGSSLPPSSILIVYLLAAVFFVFLIAIRHVALRKTGATGLN